MPPTNYPLRPKVIAAITALFAPNHRETINKILVEEFNGEVLRTINPDAYERIQLAVLKLSGGDVEKFLDAVQTSQLDWRDVLVWTGFGNDLKAHLKWVDEFR